ncbi:MAG: PA14 domain-containing protein [Verrucomicrobiales bacterium]|nr:PA14 domain-containing protein [Verrucomicrobiales bacterium]
MKTFARISLAIAVALTLAFTASGANQTISVDFQGRSSDAGFPPTVPLAPTEVAGVVEVGNWNAVDNHYNGDSSLTVFNAPNDGTTGPLKDSTGAVTPITLKFSATGSWYNSVPFDQATTPNARMMNGLIKRFLDPGKRAEFTFNHLEDAQYDIYLYIGNDADGTRTDISDGNFITTYRVIQPQQFYNSSTFVEAKNTAPNGPFDTGNYVHFKNLATYGGSTLTVYLTYFSGWNGVGVAGIQLIKVGPAVPPIPQPPILAQEGFNSDGEADTPPRYTTTGRDVYGVERIETELTRFDQKGPIFWAHNFDVPFVGIPHIPARRMIFTWQTDVAGAASPDLLQLFDSSVSWLLNGKVNATVVAHPNAAAIGELAGRLTAAGHTVVDDDTTTYPNDKDVPGDLFIAGPGVLAGNESRFAIVPKPVIVMDEPFYDDMLVGSIGSAATFDPGQVTIAAPGHPAAGGKTGSFTGFNLPAQPFGLVGSFLPPGATTLATVTRVIPPAVNNLGDVDAMIAGTKQHDKTTNTVTDIDFSDGSFGNWVIDNSIPGGYAGNWGLRIQGKISVTTAGTYRFAVGSEDGARLQIDIDNNGFSAADTVIEDSGPHGYQVVYRNVAFASAGAYDFEVRSYNAGGGGTLEVSVANVPVPVPDDALDSAYWEVLSQTGTAFVTLQSAANVTGYLATGANVEVQTPLIVLLNEPDVPAPGSFYDGGPFTGYEGEGFFGAAGLNKWPYPDTQNYRSLQLKPVNVSGKSNVKLTIALAATVTDFEDSDFLDIVVYTNGIASNPTTLAHFRAVANAIQPWLADEKDSFARRLTKQFADFTYDVPASATDLVVEIRAATSWWSEIVAFDNIRITQGALAAPQITSISKSASNVTITWINGGTLESTTVLAGATTQWTSTGDSDGSYTEAVAGTKFFRLRR